MISVIRRGRCFWKALHTTMPLPTSRSSRHPNIVDHKPAIVSLATSASNSGAGGCIATVLVSQVKINVGLTVRVKSNVWYVYSS